MKNKIILTSSLLVSVCFAAFAGTQPHSGIDKAHQLYDLDSSKGRQMSVLENSKSDIGALLNSQLSCELPRFKGLHMPASDMSTSVCIPEQEGIDLFASSKGKTLAPAAPAAPAAIDMAASLWMPEKPGMNLFFSRIDKVPAASDASKVVEQRVHVNQVDLISDAVHAANDAYAIYKGADFGPQKRVFDYNGSKEGFVSFSKSETGKDRITLAFRGTQKGSDWLTNLNGAFKTSGASIGLTEGSVHRGFLQRYTESREAIYTLINDILKENNLNVNDVEFVVSGHSLGGALATVAAIDIRHHLALEADVKLVTSNSPRVVDNKGADEATKALGEKNMIRLWRGGDPVSALAPGILGYKHVGTPFKLERYSNPLFYDGKPIPNHGDKLNVLAVDGQEVILPEPHQGVRQQISEGFNTFTQAVSTKIKSAWDYVKSFNPFA